MMSNESNRDVRTVTPSDLQASDFFPPGHGWNKEDESVQAARQRMANHERDLQDEIAEGGRRPN